MRKSNYKAYSFIKAKALQPFWEVERSASPSRRNYAHWGVFVFGNVVNNDV